MNCPEFEADIALYVGDDLPAERIPVVTAHLRACTACRAFAEEMAECGELVHALRTVEIAPARVDALRREVVARYVAHRDRPRWFSFFLQPRWAAAMFAVIALGVALGWLSLSFESVQEAARTFPIPSMVQTKPPAGSSISTNTPTVLPFRVLRPRRVKPIASNVSKPIPTKSESVAETARVAPEPQRIEIQTADPNVRIIWFVQPTAEKPAR